MKEFRTLSIALSDGLHSLERIRNYLELDEEADNSLHYRLSGHGDPELVIKKGTTGQVLRRGTSFELLISHHI